MSTEPDSNKQVLSETKKSKPKSSKKNKPKNKQPQPKIARNEESRKIGAFRRTHRKKIRDLPSTDRLKEDSFCDVTVLVDGHEFPAHKFMLGNFSLFFRKKFKDEMQGQPNVTVSIDKISHSVFKIILDCMYTATIPLTIDNAIDLFVASDYLEISDLMNLCVEFLNLTVNPTNCLELHQKGLQFNCSSLCHSAENIIGCWFHEIKDQQQFKELEKQELEHFVSLRNQKIYGSKDVWDSVLSWVNYDLEKREKDFEELFKLVELHFMPVGGLDAVQQHALVRNSPECQKYLQESLLCTAQLSQLCLSSAAKTANTVDDQPTEELLGEHPDPNVHKCVEDNVSTDPESIKPSDECEEKSVSNPIDKLNYFAEVVQMIVDSKYPGIPLNNDGFADVNDILSNVEIQRKFGPKTMKDVHELVYSGERKKFELAVINFKWKIRAVDEFKALLKIVRSTLNKLTPQKFSPLMSRLQKISNRTTQCMKEMVNIIVEEAIADPKFSEVYANCCRVMANYRVTDSGNEAIGQPVITFRHILLARCQEMFEKYMEANESKWNDFRKNLEEVSPALKNIYGEEVGYAEAEERSRYMGNIILIGELFNVGLFTEKIMHNTIIMKLFNTHDEFCLEMLCALMTIVGKHLDHAEGKSLMDQYFNQIDKIIEMKVSIRIKFKLQDLKDLRKLNWERKNRNYPKTLDEIHDDLKQERNNMAMLRAARAPVRKVRGSTPAQDNSSENNQQTSGRIGRARRRNYILVENKSLSLIDDAGLYPKVYHGNYFYNWEAIKRSGLSRASKQSYIFFAIGMTDNPKVFVGAPNDCEIAVEINLEKAIKGGLKFFKASSDVIVSEGNAQGRIPPQFFTSVIQIHPYQLLKFDISSSTEDVQVQDSEVSKLEEQRSDTKSQT